MSSQVFPYSRHSSYDELRDLVGSFGPRDIYPCVVDEEAWNTDLSISSLFGDLCTGSGFAYDKIRAEKLKPPSSLRRRSKRRRANTDSQETHRSSAPSSSGRTTPPRSRRLTKELEIELSSPRPRGLRTLAENDPFNPTTASRNTRERIDDDIDGGGKVSKIPHPLDHPKPTLPREANKKSGKPYFKDIAERVGAFNDDTFSSDPIIPLHCSLKMTGGRDSPLSSMQGSDHEGTEGEDALGRAPAASYREIVSRRLGHPESLSPSLSTLPPTHPRPPPSIGSDTPKVSSDVIHEGEDQHKNKEKFYSFDSSSVVIPNDHYTSPISPQRATRLHSDVASEGCSQTETPPPPASQHIAFHYAGSTESLVYQEGHVGEDSNEKDHTQITLSTSAFDSQSSNDLQTRLSRIYPLPFSPPPPHTTAKSTSTCNIHQNEQSKQAKIFRRKESYKAVRQLTSSSPPHSSLLFPNPSPSSLTLPINGKEKSRSKIPREGGDGTWAPESGGRLFSMGGDHSAEEVEL